MKQKQFGEELLRIYEERGELTPSIVVEEAEDEESPLHDRFEWDNDKAAHEYRLAQARTLIRVQTKKDSKLAKLVHVFVHVPAKGSGEGVYHTREVIAANVDMFGRALNELERFLLSAQNSVEDMQSIAPRGKKRRITRIGRTIGQAQEQSEELRV
jgi:hypothetical protein